MIHSIRLTILLAGFVAPLSASGQVANHWDVAQVRRYVHNSDLQWRSTWQHLAKFTFDGRERILDIGCGDGRHSAFLSRLVPKGSVQGIDPNPNMLAWAGRQYVRDEFPNLSFAAGDYVNHAPRAPYDVITGFFSFHVVPKDDREQAIANLYSWLVPGGRLIMVIPPHPNSNREFFKAIGDTLNSDLWAPQVTASSGNFYFENETELRERFARQPFRSLAVHYVPSIDPFVVKKDFAQWILGTFDFPQRVPAQFRDLLVSDIIDRYAALRPDALVDGVYYGKWGRYEVYAEKGGA